MSFPTITKFSASYLSPDLNFQVEIEGLKYVLLIFRLHTFTPKFSEYMRTHEYVGSSYRT
jgi:hypothetical protein